MSDELAVDGGEEETIVSESDNQPTEGNDQPEATEVEADETEVTETEEEITEEDGETEETEGEGDEEVIINFGGTQLAFKKGEVPQDVFDATQDFVKNVEAAHGKRSQKLSEDSKEVESKAKTFDKLLSLSGDALNAYSRGQALQNEIDWIDNQDVNALWQSQDPKDRDRARQMSDQRSQLQRELNQTINTVDSFERQREQTLKEENERLMTEGRKKVDSVIKDFSTVHAPVVEKYVQETFGMTEDEASQWPLNPAVTQMAYESMQYRKMMEAANKKPAPKPKNADPVSNKKTRGNAKRSFDLVKDADKMSNKQWQKLREAELRKKGARP